MANVIRNKRGTTKPSASDIVTGEIAVKTDDAKLYIENDSGHVFEVGETLGTYSSSIITYTVTVASKTSAHRYNGTGSSSGYKINGIFAPFLSLTPGNTYRFDQSDSSNYGHPLRFYLEADKTTEYTTNVTTNATAGASSNAYVQIVITDATPIVLHYQCSSHGYMGNSVTSNGTSIDGSNVISGTIAAARIATLNQNTTGTSGGFTAGSASNLNTGTLPNDRFPATLPAISGENLTNLPFALSSDAQHNTVAGTYAGESFDGTNAQNNTLIGKNAGRYITTADNVVAIGRNAGVSITTNSGSTLVGTYAGESNTASEISAFGYNSLQDNTTGTKNSGFGRDSLKSNTTGTKNTASGFSALREQTTGTDNSAYGCEAGRNITTGIDNTCLGSFAGDAITTGSNNLILGHEAAASAVDVSNEITLGNSSITKFRVPGVNFVIKDSTATEDYVLTCDANGEASWEAGQTGSGGTDSDARFNTLGGSSAGASLQSNPSNSYEAKDNTFFGYQTATAMTTGYENVAMGYRSMYNTTIGGRTIAIGNETVYTSTKYDGGVIIGYKAGRELDGSTGNAANAVAIGHSAMGRIEEGGYNAVAIGQEALYGASGSNGGSYSVAIGQAAQKNITSGYRNASVGNQSMEGVTTGYQNSAFGTSSLQQLTTGTLNTAAGNQAGFRVTTGSNNILIGQSAGEELTTGSYNTIVGAKAGEAYSGGDPDLTTGTGNILIGARAVPSSSSVNYEATIGSVNINKFRVPGINFILKDNGGTPTEGHVLTVDANGEASFAAAAGGGLDSDAKQNTLAGTSAGSSVSTSSIGYNAFFGYQAGKDYAGTRSTAVGHNALKTNYNGINNAVVGNSCFENATSNFSTGLGSNAGYNTTSGGNNTFIGASTGYNNTTGGNNTAVGYGSYMFGTTAGNNTCVGNQAGKQITTGASNTIIGSEAGNAGNGGTNDLTTGSNNIIIGHDATASSATVSNEVTLGDSSISTIRCNTQTISSLSDRRDKTDINILNLGLDFVRSLNPVKFKWETRDGNGKDGSYEAGFIAQDFQQLQKENDADYLGLVMDQNPDRLEASYGKLVPILVKAIQELTIEVEKLKSNG